MIEHLTSTSTGVSVGLDGRTANLSWRWLRDHARDANSFLASAQQRMVKPGVVAAAGIGIAELGDGVLTVSWDDGTVASFDHAFLAPLHTPLVMYGSIGAPPEPWSGAEMRHRITQHDVGALGEPNGLRNALDCLSRDGVIALRGVEVNTAATRDALERFGYVRSTIFGDLWEFSSDESAGPGFDDTASTPLEITPHTDGTYSNDAPGLLGLHCHIYEATGGENVFVDSHALANRLRAESSEHFELLRTIEIPGQYIGDGAHLIARRPVLRYEATTVTGSRTEHDDERLVQVSYNHHDRAPFLLPEPTMTNLFDALHHFDSIANDPSMQFELALRPGDMVIFDNWRVLHGRRAFAGARHIAGGYINREDVDSATRLLSS